MKKVLYMHYGSGNHGCEALVRTSAMLLGGPKNVKLWSLCKPEDVQYGVEESLEDIVADGQLSRFSLAYIEALFKRKVLHQQDAYHNTFLKNLFRGNIAISIGGDNYCYDSSTELLIKSNKIIRKWAKATVLWGCSIDPEAITQEMKEDLAGYDLITARETLTYELLKPINPNTKLVADSAFLLPTVLCECPEAFIEGNTVGVNVSPMIMEFSEEGELILESYSQMIQHILDNTDMNVALIPHVVWKRTDDREPLQRLYERFMGTNRICLIEDAPAEVLKGYISRCRFFVGARTHATIAAYSSGVPTLVVGYSVKSRGIAKDLFGTEENYVLSIHDIANKYELTNAFSWLVDHEKEIQNHLAKVLPNYIEKARFARELIKTL